MENSYVDYANPGTGEIIKDRIRACKVDYKLDVEIIIAPEFDSNFKEYPVQLHSREKRTAEFLRELEETEDND